jgi:hypothetical protein
VISGVIALDPTSLVPRHPVEEVVGIDGHLFELLVENQALDLWRKFCSMKNILEI